MFKDIIEVLNLDDDITELTPKQILKGTVLSLIDKGLFEDKSELEDFFKAVLPHNNKTYFMYVADEEGTYVNLSFNDYYEYIKALCIMSQYRYTLYFHPTSFSKNWFKDKNVTSFKCIYIDIDDVDFEFDIATATKEQVIDFIINKYHIPYNLLGDVINISGHGIHNVYYIPETNDVEMRQKYVDSLITFYKGDKMTRNPGKKFRVPTSYNIKDPSNPIRSRMFIINKDPNRDIHRLDPLLKTKEEIHQYFTEYNAKLKAKKNATRAKNQVLKGSLANDEINNTAVKTKEANTAISAAVQAENSKKYNDDYEPIDITNLRYHNNFSNFNSCWNVIYDLNNYIVRNGSMCLVGKRNIFFHILTNYCLPVMTIEETIEFCEQYYNEENGFYKEMIKIIKATYRRNRMYQYRYETISSLLDFSPLDIAESRCNFSEERKLEARKAKNRKHYLAKFGYDKTPHQLLKELQIDYIKENPDKPIKEIMLDLNISQATAYRLRNKAKSA